MVDIVDAVNYTDLPFNTDSMVLMPVINSNIQSILCYSNKFEFSVVNYDNATKRFGKTALLTNKSTATDFFDLHKGSTGDLKSITYELNKNINDTSFSSVFVMTFERCAILLTIESQHEQGVITEISIKLKDIFYLDESDVIVDFVLSHKKIWLISKPNDFYLIMQDSPPKNINNASNIEIVRNFERPYKDFQPASILFVEPYGNGKFWILFGSKLNKISRFSYNEEKELWYSKDYELSEYLVKFKPFENVDSKNYVAIPEMKYARDTQSGMGFLSTKDHDKSILYSEINNAVKEVAMGPPLRYRYSSLPSFSVITADKKLHVFVSEKEVDIKNIKELSVHKSMWSANKMVLFVITPGLSMFSLSMENFLSTQDIVESVQNVNNTTFYDEMIFANRSLEWSTTNKSIGVGSIDDPISLDDMESPVKLDSSVKESAKRNTPLSGQKSMTDYFGKKLSPSPNKVESVKKKLSFEAANSKEPIENLKKKSFDEIFIEKINDVFTNFEKEISVDSIVPEEPVRKLEPEESKTSKTPEKSQTNERISIANLISSGKPVVKTTTNLTPVAKISKDDINNTVVVEPEVVEEPKKLPASDSITMKLHVPAQIVPKSLKRITPPANESGLQPVAKKQKKELEPLDLLEEYSLNPILAFSKVRLSIPKLRAAFEVIIKDEYSINVINKGSGDQAPTKLFLKYVGDKEDDTHPSEAQFIPKSVSLVTGTPTFFAYSTDNGVIYICSSQTGRRLEQPLMLGVPISMLESAGNFLVCVTCVGELYCWNVEKMELAHPVASLYPILSPSLRAGNDVLSRAENITSASVTNNGVSLITLSNGDSYLYDKMMQSWSLINDNWWAYSSKHWDASNTKAGLLSSANTKPHESIMKMLEYKTNEELNRKGQAKFIQNFTKTMLLKEGFENLEQSASISHLFNKLYVYKKFEEFVEYQDTLIVLCSTLAEFGLVTMLQELFDTLFDVENEDSIGPYKKHDLLKMCIASVYQVGTAESKRTAKMYSDNL